MTTLTRSIASTLFVLLLGQEYVAKAATITVINADPAGTGFNDPTPRSPRFGNAGTTLGQQRLNAFNAAAAYWANRLVSPVPIVVRAEMKPLPCTSTSGTLGQAGPDNAFRNALNAPLGNTWYVVALANARAGTDLDPPDPDIHASFNSSVDTDPNCLALNFWHYGIGDTPPAQGLSFYETVLHELAHGLGFTTYVNLSSGARGLGFDDAFMVNLEDHSTGKRWSQMFDFERSLSATDSGDLHWVGPAVVAASGGLLGGRHSSGHVRMYAPSSLNPGSSVAHFDTAVSPNEIMEPFEASNATDIMTTALLRDIGWSPQQSTGACVRDADTACLQNGRFEVNISWNNNDGSGAGNVMGFSGQRAENTESAFYYFQSQTNFEMGLKILNACIPSFGNKFWVFISGLTDQGWQASIRDTQTGAVRVYSNPRGLLTPTVADTQAFNCQ